MRHFYIEQLEERKSLSAGVVPYWEDADYEHNNGIFDPHDDHPPSSFVLMLIGLPLAYFVAKRMMREKEEDK